MITLKDLNLKTMIERLHAIQQTAHYLIESGRAFSRRERDTLYVMIQEMARSVESWLTRQTHNADLSFKTLQAIQSAIDEPRSPEATLDLIALALKEFYDQDMPF